MYKKLSQNMFTIIATTSLLIAGCSSDEFGGKSNTKPAEWSIGKVSLVTTDQVEIDLGHSEAKKLTEYSMNDKLVFHNHDSMTRATLTVNTKCFDENQKYSTHTITEGIHQSYEMYEFMPADLLYRLHLSTATSLFCNFEIVAKSAKNDTHQFSLESLRVTVGKKPIENLPLYYKGQLVSDRENALMPVAIEDLSNYTLANLESQEHNYKLICGEKLVRHVMKTNSENLNVSLKMFFEPETNLDELFNTQKYCQIFHANNKQRVLKVSPMLLMKPTVEMPIISYFDGESKPLAQHGDSIEMKSFTLYNTSNMNLKIGLDVVNLFAELRLALRDSETQKIYGTIARLPILTSVTGAKSSEVDGQLRFQIAPRQTVKVSITTPLRNLRCHNQYSYKLGVYYQFANKLGLTLHVLNDINSPAGVENELANVMILKNHEFYRPFATDTAVTEPIILNNYIDNLCSI